MREEIRNKERINHIIEAIDNISEFVNEKTFEEYVNDKMLRFAVVKNLEIIGEVAYALTKDFVKANPQIEWDDMIKMRHVLVHGYYQINERIVWQTITTRLADLRENLVVLANTFV